MRIVMVTDDVRIDRRILAEAESLAGHGHEVIVVAGWEQDLLRHDWHGPVKIERFRADCPGPIVEDYAFSKGTPFWLVPPPQSVNLAANSDAADVPPPPPPPPDPPLSRFAREARQFVVRAREFTAAAREFIARVRRPIGLMIQKSRLLVIVTTAIRQSVRRVCRKLIVGLILPMRLLVLTAATLRRSARTCCITAMGALRRWRASMLAADTIDVQDFGSIDEPSAAERVLIARLRYLDPDLIHAHDLPQLRVAVHVKRALHIPLIYDAHELYPEISILQPRDKAMLGAREGALLPECDQVITVNPLIADEMVRRYGIAAPMVIQNAVSAPEGFCAAVRYDRFRQEFGIGKSDYILLYQGWLATHRGLQKLVRAMPLLPDNIHLVFLGYGAAAELRTLADQTRVGRRVHVKDAVSQDELLFWTASADIGLIPYQASVDLNTKYCSPNKLYEYIEAGLPMLGNSDLPFVRSVITSNGFGRVAALRMPDHFARAIMSMVNEGRAGLNRFRENILRKRAAFAWSVEERKLLMAYDVLLPTKARLSQDAGMPAPVDAKPF